MKESTNRTVAVFLIVGLLASVVLAGFVSFYASSHPDGLEAVAEEQGFAETAADSPVGGSALADYGVAGVEDERWSVGLAGVVGVGITALVGFGLFLFLASGSGTTPSRSSDATDPSAAERRG